MPYPFHVVVRMKYVFVNLILVHFILNTVYGLYEDQVGDKDWHQSYVGHVTWLSFDYVSSGRRKVLLATEGGVIAAVNAGPGSIAWRQELEKNGIAAVLHHRSSLLTVSGNEFLIIRSWDLDTGLLKWEIPTNVAIATKNSLDSQWRPGGVLATLAGNKKDYLVVVSGSNMMVYSARSGKEQWNMTLPEGIPCTLTSQGASITVWLLGNQELTSWEYKVGSKTPPENLHTLVGSWLTPDMECVISGDDEQSVMVCFTREENTQIYAANLTNDEFLPVKLEGVSTLQYPLHLHATSGNFIHIGSDLYKLDTPTSTLSHICSSCRTEDSQTEKGGTVRLTVEESGQNVLLRHTTEYDNGEYEVDTRAIRGSVANVKVFAFHKADGSLTWRTLVVRKDSSIALISQTGDLVWVREEGLANIIAVEMVDLPSAQFEAEGFLSLLESDANPLTLAMRRWKLQVSLVQDVIKDVLERGMASLIQPTSSEELLRDIFNTRKIILAVTAYNKIYALDSNNGQIIWQLYLPLLHPLPDSNVLLYVLRSSSHPPHPPLAVLVGGAENCDNSILFFFDPITGELTNENPPCLSHDIRQSVLLPLTDHTHQRVLLFLDSMGFTHCYPTGCGQTNQNVPVFIYTGDIKRGIMSGYQVKEEDNPAKQVWQIVVPSNERILIVADKPSDHAHSLGRVRANRDVQYKYLNPNMIAMVTQTFEQSKSSLIIYLLDSVTGGVVYRSVHKHASEPVGILLCENWIIYYYYNIKSHRNELAVMEMYDPRNETESVWSSLAPPTLPLITTQSYIFPTSIVTLSLSTTQRGITSRSLLFGLNSGHVVALRKDFLDPRRNITATQEMMDEGVPPYIPELPIQARSYINYNQTVSAIKGIKTAHTGLESTSIVFVYGIDLYLTRVQPSRQFDLLAEDFDYTLIAGVVVALVLATFILSFLSSRKTLKLLWK